MILTLAPALRFRRRAQFRPYRDACPAARAVPGAGAANGVACRGPPAGFRRPLGVPLAASDCRCGGRSHACGNIASGRFAPLDSADRRSQAAGPAQASARIPSQLRRRSTGSGSARAWPDNAAIAQAGFAARARCRGALAGGRPPELRSALFRSAGNRPGSADCAAASLAGRCKCGGLPVRIRSTGAFAVVPIVANALGSSASPAAGRPRPAANCRRVPTGRTRPGWRAARRTRRL